MSGRRALRTTGVRHRLRTRPRPCASILCAVLAAVPAFASATATQEPLPVDPAVSIGRLANGLTYYIRENRCPERRAELRLVVNAGSVLEDGDQLGLAHFVEHMAFNGTTHYPGRTLVDRLEREGMRFGVDFNAYTTFDETVYRLVIPTDRTGLLTEAFQVLEDWAQGIAFEPAEVRKERGVVIEEWRLGRGAPNRLHDQVFPVVFRGSPYAERSVIGMGASIESFDPEALHRFYRDWYRPDLMAIVAVGAFDGREVERLIRSHLGRIPARPAARPRPEPAFPRREAGGAAIATDAEATATQVKLLFLRPAPERGTVSGYRESLVSRFYMMMLNERLRELQARPAPRFVSAGIAMRTLVRGTEVLSLTATVPDAGVRDGLEAVLTEVERIERHGFGAAELERAKRRVLRGLEHDYVERETTRSDRLAAEYVRHFLEHVPIPGIARELELARRLVPGIALDEAGRTAHDWLGVDDPIVVVKGPASPDVRIVAGDSLLAVLDDVRQADIAPADKEITELLPPAGRGREASAAAEAALVSADLPEKAILREAYDPTFDVTKWTLDNGVRVILKPTRFQADQVLVSAYSPGGSSLVADSLFTSSRFAVEAVQASGLGRFGAAELRRALAGRIVRVEPFIDLYQEGLTGEASPVDLTALFELIYLYFTAPRADPAAFAALRSTVRARLAHRGASPITAFQDTVAAVLGGWHPRSRPLDAAALDSLDLTRALAVYHDRFADASDFTFVLVGRFALDSIRPLVRRYLGNLPALGRAETPRDLGIHPPAGRVEREVRRGIEPQSRTRIVFTGPFDDSPVERLQLDVLARVLELRLRRELREERGGTYDVAVGASAGRVPSPGYSLAISFGSAPGRVDELVGALFSEIDALHRTGATEAELVKIRAAARRQREIELKSNRFWITQLASADRTGEPLEQQLDTNSLLDSLTGADMRRAAEWFIDSSRYVRVTLTPEMHSTGP